MNKELKRQLPYIQSVVELFHPFVEGTLHDLKKGTVSAIFNNMSGRQEGDATPFKELNIPTDYFPDRFPPYYRTSPDGRKWKCVSITVRDETAQPIGLICFNFDVSLFHGLESQLSTLLHLNGSSDNPIELFKNNWQEEIHSQIDQFMKERKLLLNRLNRQQKKELVGYLQQKGVFHIKNGAPFVADLLGISRATVYNYMG
jgi:predicted transcriptional regulator YheO